MAKNKHLTDAERLEIEHGLRHGPSLKNIAARPGGRTQRGSLSLSEKRGRGAPRPSSHFFGGRDAENTARTPATERTAPRQAPFRTD